MSFKKKGTPKDSASSYDNVNHKFNTSYQRRRGLRLSVTKLLNSKLLEDVNNS